MFAERLPPAPELPQPPSQLLVLALRIGAAFGLLVIITLLVLGLAHVNGLSTTVAGNQRADTRALCALREDLQTRVTTARTILSLHPGGVAGISAATVNATVANEQHTITALSSINCAGVK